MKHPARDEWISYLYDEVAPAKKSALAEHLQQCPECQAQLGGFQQAMGALDEWTLPAHRRSSAAGTWLKWAAAAAVVLSVGFAVGRSTASGSREIAALRSEMKQLVAQSTADANVETIRLLGELNESWKTRLQAAQLQHDNDYASLRKELETVAILTEASFQQARQQLVQLAEYTRPASADGTRQ